MLKQRVGIESTPLSITTTETGKIIAEFEAYDLLFSPTGDQIAYLTETDSQLFLKILNCQTQQTEEYILDQAQIYFRAAKLMKWVDSNQVMYFQRQMVAGQSPETFDQVGLRVDQLSQDNQKIENVLILDKPLLQVMTDSVTDMVILRSLGERIVYQLATTTKQGKHYYSFFEVESGLSVKELVRFEYVQYQEEFAPLKLLSQNQMITLKHDSRSVDGGTTDNQYQLIILPISGSN